MDPPRFIQQWKDGLSLRIRGAAVSCNFKDHYSVNSNSDEKKILFKTKEASKKAVSLLVSIIRQFKNPFTFNADSKSELHNIATGSIATEGMRENISDTKVREKESTIKY